MTEENPPPEVSPLSNTLFFTSLKNLSFDYTLPLKSSLNRFCREQRGEASKTLFEYLCYKIVQKQITTKGINEQIAIISEKFLSSKECIANLSKLNYSQKKFVLIPICHSVTHKWNAIIFVHLERQILQYINKTATEPIVAKIISSNINSEEDDYLLNTTMDKIENAFNFTSPEDIQFEVDSINICDQPNTSVFLLNFIEGLVSQENNTDTIMNYIMKLYDESSNTNSIGSNNYFVSFNKENEIFQNLIENYVNEIKIYAKNEGFVTQDKENADINQTNIFELIKFQPEEEDEMESEEEALKIVEKNNEEALKHMEEQELFFSNNMNPPFNLNMEEVNNVPPKTILGLIQEVENESDEDTEQRNEMNNNSLRKKDEVNFNTEEDGENDELEISLNNEEGNNNIKIQENKENEESNENNNNNEDNNKINNNEEYNRSKKDDTIEKNENELTNEKIKEENKKEKEDDNTDNKSKEDKKENEIKNTENNEIKQNKINNNGNNLIYNENIKTENKLNKNMPKFGNKLDKIKNEIINNLSKENKALRGSYRQKNNALEKLITEGTNENSKELSKSVNNSNIIIENSNENTNTYNVINLQRNQKYNNSSFYVSKGTNTKNKKREDKLLIPNQNNINYLEDKSNIIKNQKNEIKNNVVDNNSNNIIYESNYNKIKDINTDLINNINDDNIKNIQKITGKTEIKASTQISQKNQNIKKESNVSNNNCNRGKNTIIINETSNNNTVINFIEIKNNFGTNNLNNLSDNENEIPEDGVINKIIETFSPNKTLSGMKKDVIDNDDDFIINKNKTYKGKSAINFEIFSETNQKDKKLTLLNNFLYGNDFLNSGNNNNDDIHRSMNQFNHYNLNEEYNFENNKIGKEKDGEAKIEVKNSTIQNKISKDSINGNNAPKRVSKKLKYRSGPEKKRLLNNGDNNIDIFKEYKSSNCTLNMANDLNCGCAGVNDTCFIF